MPTSTRHAVPTGGPGTAPDPSGETSGGPGTHGWTLSLGFRGRHLAQRSVRGPAAVRIGEDPSCAVVVPGLGAAVVLAVGDRVAPVPGLTGEVHREATADAPEPLDRELTLRPGDRVLLRHSEHPEITLELRRQSFQRLPLATLVNLRELGLQLAIGAGLVAGLVLLVQHQRAVNVLEVKGEPDDPEQDSPLVRAMFAVVPTAELKIHDLRVIAPPVVAAPVVAAPVDGVDGVGEVEVAPLPLQALTGEFIATPTEVIDEQPRKKKRRGRDLDEVGMLAMLSPSEVNDFANLLVGVDEGALGGVYGGVVGGPDMLAERTPEASGLAMLGVQGGSDVALGSAIPQVVDVIEAPGEPEPPTPTDSVVFVEDIMGPGVADEPPVPKDMPAQPGADSHANEGGAVVYGVVDGVAAVAPASDCEDPTLVKPRQLDVVFVVDVSTTMTFMLDRIEKQIAQVDQQARAQGLDTRYGLVVFVDDVKLGNAGQPYADLAALQAELATWRAFTAGNRQIHRADRNVDWPENSLDALHTAATDFAWRPADTTLHMVVHATDDDFGEAPAFQSGQAVRSTYAQTLAALRTAQVRMFSFAAKIGGQCECLDVRPGLFTRFQGRPSLPDATGGAVFDIDEVARGTLSFSAAVGGAIQSGVCSRYPLSPFGAKR